MATFEIQRNRISPSGQPGAAYAQANVDTGADAVARAFSEAGNRIYELGAAKADAANAIKGAEQELEYQRITAKKMAEMEKTFDTQRQAEILQEYESETGALRTGIPDVDNAFDVHYKSTLQGNINSLEGLAHRNQIQSLNDGTVAASQKALASGNKKVYDKLWDTMVKVGAMTPEKAAAMKEAWEGDFILTRAKSMIDIGGSDNLKGAGDILDTMTQQAKENPDRYNVKQLAVMDDLKVHLDAVRNRRDSELRQQQNADTLDAYNKMGTPEFTMEYLRSTSLDANTIIRLNEMNKDIVESRRRGNISSFEDGDPVVLANVQKAIDLNPNAVQPEQIYNGVGRGLGSKYVPSLVDRLEKRKADANKPAGKYRSELASLYEKKMFGDVGSQKATDRYLDMSARLDAYLESNPSEKEMREFFNQLIVKDVEWGRTKGPNVLPGWDEWPNRVMVNIGGEQVAADVKYGTIIERNGERWQAIGKREGEIQWLKFRMDENGTWQKIK